jgi:putative transposase
VRVNRPTDNSRTERFFGTVKQEKIYLTGNYPVELTARKELGAYIYHYHHVRPHQSLWNFTPAYVHQVHNKSQILDEFNRLKQDSKENRKTYWQQFQKQQNALLNSCNLSRL